MAAKGWQVLGTLMHMHMQAGIAHRCRHSSGCRCRAAK